MIKHVGWLLAAGTPFVIVFGTGYLPYPGSLLAAGFLTGVFIGYLLYEHVTLHRDVMDSVLWEQILLGIVILAVLATVVT